MIASTPAGYAKSGLMPDQVKTYTCADCRMEPARIASETARLRALQPKVRLQEPIVAARAYARRNVEMNPMRSIGAVSNGGRLTARRRTRCSVSRLRLTRTSAGAWSTDGTLGRSTQFRNGRRSRSF
jgi:hypothetical protein